MNQDAEENSQKRTLRRGLCTVATCKKAIIQKHSPKPRQIDLKSRNRLNTKTTKYPPPLVFYVLTPVSFTKYINQSSQKHHLSRFFRRWFHRGTKGGS